MLLHTWHEFPLQRDEGALMQRWARIRVLRSQVQGRLEDSRGQGIIGSSLAAEVEIHAVGDDFALLDSLGDDMRLIFVTSAARVMRAESAGKEEISVTHVFTRNANAAGLSGGCGINVAHPTIWADGINRMVPGNAAVCVSIWRFSWRTQYMNLRHSLILA